MKRGTLLPAVAAVAALAVPTTASAATSIDLGGDSLAITGDAFRNDIEVRRVADGGQPVDRRRLGLLLQRPAARGQVPNRLRG
jgi:hypothetical protein